MKPKAWLLIRLAVLTAVLCVSIHRHRMVLAIRRQNAALEVEARLLEGFVRSGSASSNRAAPHKPLGARNPKLTPAQQHLTSEDLDAMDAMKEGNFEEAAQILHETDRKPEDWLIELRKKWGSTNPDALLGPSWEEIQKWGEERKP